MAASWNMSRKGKNLQQNEQGSQLSLSALLQYTRVQVQCKREVNVHHNQGHWVKSNPWGCWKDYGLHLSTWYLRAWGISKTYSNIPETIIRTKPKQLHACPCFRSTLFKPPYCCLLLERNTPNCILWICPAKHGYSSLTHMVSSTRLAILADAFPGMVDSSAGQMTKLCSQAS